MRISKNAMLRLKSYREDRVIPPRLFYSYLLCDFAKLVPPTCRERNEYDKELKYYISEKWYHPGLLSCNDIQRVLK